MNISKELKHELMEAVLGKIVQRAHGLERRHSTHHKTCLVPAGLLAEAAHILGIDRDFT